MISSERENPQLMDLTQAKKILQEIVYSIDLSSEPYIDLDTEHIRAAVLVVSEDLAKRLPSNRERDSFDDSSLKGSRGQHKFSNKAVGVGDLELEIVQDEREAAPHSVILKYRSYGTDEDLADAWREFEAAGAGVFFAMLEEEDVIEHQTNKPISADAVIVEDTNIVDLVSTPTQEVLNNFREIQLRLYMRNGMFHLNYEDLGADRENILGEISLIENIPYKAINQDLRLGYLGFRWMLDNILNWERDDFRFPEDLSSNYLTSSF